MVREQTFSTLDSFLVGWLSLQGFQPELVHQGDKIAFFFKVSDGLNRSIAAYHTGATIEAHVFASSVKAIKGKIHSTRKRKGRRADGKIEDAFY